MPISFIYWFLMLLQIIFGMWWGWSQPAPARYGIAGGGIVTFLLFLLIGLKIMGAPISGG